MPVAKNMWNNNTTTNRKAAPRLKSTCNYAVLHSSLCYTPRIFKAGPRQHRDAVRSLRLVRTNRAAAARLVRTAPPCFYNCRLSGFQNLGTDCNSNSSMLLSSSHAEAATTYMKMTRQVMLSMEPRCPGLCCTLEKCAEPC